MSMPRSIYYSIEPYLGKQGETDIQPVRVGSALFKTTQRVACNGFDGEYGLPRFKGESSARPRVVVVRRETSPMPNGPQIATLMEYPALVVPCR